MRYGWDHPLTAERYAAFCARPTRYHFANQELARAAEIGTARSLIDFAAGLGHTAEALLAHERELRITCVEPAAAMREAGQRRLGDPRVSWAAELPASGVFDRVVCGAGLWQADDLSATLRKLSALLAADGRLCFTIPSLYLRIPDRPGGGADPLLVGLFAALAKGRSAPEASLAPLPSEEELAALLAECGLSPQLERLEYRLTQRELRDWLRIPVLTDALLGDLAAEARDALIDAAFAATDAQSYRFEGWTVVSAQRRV